MDRQPESSARPSRRERPRRCGWSALLADVAGDVRAPEATPLVAGLVRRLDDDGPWSRHELDRAWLQAGVVDEPVGRREVAAG